MSSISSCCTQDECGDCKGHNVSQSNPEEQIQDYQKRLGTWVALELDILPILLSFLHILNCIFDACKAGTGPINVTLDMFSVSLRTGPHSQSHGQYWIYLGMQKEEHGAMLRPGTVWTCSQQQNDETLITLKLRCKPGICACHLKFTPILRSIRVFAILSRPWPWNIMKHVQALGLSLPVWKLPRWLSRCPFTGSKKALLLQFRRDRNKET